MGRRWYLWCHFQKGWYGRSDGCLQRIQDTAWDALNKEKDNPGVGVSSSRISKSVDTWFIIPPRYVDINRIYGNVRLHGDEKSEAIAMSVAELDEHSSDMITENLLFYRMIMVKY